MNMKLYRIAQNDNLLGEGETPLSADELEPQLNNLRKDVKTFFFSKGISVKTTRVEDEIHIYFSKKVDREDVERLLGSYLGELNGKKLGLAFDVVELR